MRRNLMGALGVSFATCAAAVAATATIDAWWSLYFAVGALRSLDATVVDDEFVLLRPPWIAIGRFLGGTVLWFPSDVAAIARNVAVLVYSGALEGDPRDASASRT